MSVRFITLCLLLIATVHLHAQKDMFIEGLQYFEAKNYQKAAEYFYADKYGNSNKELLLRRAVCNYHLGKLDEAKKDVSTLLSFTTIPDETFLYIGKIFHEEGKYKKAIENYKAYLKRLPPKAENRQAIVHLIKQCGMATRLKYKEPIAFVDNYGPEINTIYDESRMIQSPNFDSKYYFSSSREGSTGGKRNAQGKADEKLGHYKNDMYAIEMINGKWMEPTKLNPFINTSRDELALDFSADGSILYYIKSTGENKGHIYSDTFSVDKKNVLNPPKFISPINPEKGDLFFHLYNDSTIFFASNRAGGYGGYDLYVTARTKQGWTKAKNLGPNVNSKYDDSYPHISNDGKTIFFSSNRINSLGLYDVFFAEYNVLDDTWKEAENIGAPINSAGNDIAFFVSKDGFTASLSSDRKVGFGGYDLYVTYFKNQLNCQLNPGKELAFLANELMEPNAVVAVNDTKKPSSKASTKPTPKPAKKTKKTKTERGKTKKAKKVKEPVVVAEKQPVVEKEEEKPSSSPLTKEKKTEYVINTLFYVPDEKIISAANKRELDVLTDLLSVYPSLTLEIKAHTIEEGLEAYDLYFSIKRAEKVAEYLISNGIGKERIGLKGYGSNYPIAKYETAGKKSKIAERVNSRIEFFIQGAEKLPVDITLVEPYLVEYLQDPKGELFKTIEDGLSYRIQIASVKQMYQNQVLLLYNDSMIEKEYDGINYRYTLGLYEKYEDAKLLVKDLANYNISGAFIVPYIDGQRIPKTKLAGYAQYYPDLLNFMQYNDE